MKYDHGISVFFRIGVDELENGENGEVMKKFEAVASEPDVVVYFGDPC